MNQQAPSESPVYRFPEACDYLKVGETTMRGLMRDGKVSVVRIGGRSIRFTQWALDEYLRDAESQKAEVRYPTGEGVTTRHW